MKIIKATPTKMKYAAIFIVIALTITVAVLGTATPATAGTADQIINGFSETGQAAGFPTNPDGSPRQDFNAAFATYAIGLAGILSGLFVILIIYGGWLWMTAQGKEEQVGRAKKIILGSVIGITLVIAARFIAELVITYLAQTLPSGR